MRHLIVTCLMAAALAGCGPTPARAALPQGATPIAARAGVPSLEAGSVTADAAAVRPFTLATGGEALAELRFTVPGGDWEVPGREAATVTLTIDGVPNQDLVLFMGDTPHAYPVSLGALAAGPHTLGIARNARFSAPALATIALDGGAIGVVAPGDPGYETLACSPIVLSRATPHLTDTPLLMMAEVEGRTTRYTAVYSNEDGGTATPALMARWGRTADIDWVYAVETDAAGQAVKETYQGMLHFTRDFKGRHEGRHPILRTSTDNNCYDDGGTGPLRFRTPPLFTLDAARTAREEVLDRNPWAYAIMAKELFRERKAVRGGAGDPRRYAYAEFRQTSRGRGLGVAVALTGEAKPYTSHRGDGGLTAERTGWCRVAVELPRPVALADVRAIDVVGKGRGSAVLTGVRRVFTLDEAYRPVVWPVTWAGEALIDDDADAVRAYAAPPAPLVGG